MKTFKLFSMAALALVMAACSSEDNALENATPTQQQGAMKFTATLAAPGSGATTRTTYTEVTSGDDAGKINVAWKAGDQIYLYDLINGAKCTATVGTPAADGSATISGTFDYEVEAGENITATYPASAKNDDFNAKFASQAGTIDYIQDNLDYRIGTSTISVDGDQATLATALQMESQIAIWKLTLQDNAATPAALSATKVTIKNGSTVIAATTDITATSAVYLALNLKSGNISGADITIEATVGSDTYTYSKSGVSLAKGKYYQSTVKMAKPGPTLSLTSPAVGQVIGSDGKNYAAAATLPTGVTKVAMIAYVSGSNGLAIALADEGSWNWATAKSTCEAKTPAFTNGTWKLPTQDEWKNMFKANGGDEESYTGLNSAITTAGGTALQETKFYWSSTPYNESKAYYVFLDSGDTDWRNKSVYAASQVRACLAF